MSKVLDMDSPENLALREMLVDLLFVRTQAIIDKRPIHRAIRMRCIALQARNPSGQTKAILEQIRRKQLCDHELLKCITAYNELVSNETMSNRDGAVVTIKSTQTPIA